MRLRTYSSRLRALVWLLLFLLLLSACIADLEWIKSKGWFGCFFLILGAYYWDCRFRGARATFGVMSVDKDTPKAHSIPTDGAAIVTPLLGLLYAFRTIGG
jgi:hypothetical protein